MAENGSKNLDATGTTFLRPLSVRFTCMSRVLTHQHFPNKIGHKTLGSNEANKYNQTSFTRFIIHFIVNGFLRISYNA